MYYVISLFVCIKRTINGFNLSLHEYGNSTPNVKSLHWRLCDSRHILSCTFESAFHNATTPPLFNLSSTGKTLYND